MNEPVWQTTLNPSEREELESARKQKEAGNEYYKSVYRRLKSRGDARIRRANLKTIPESRSKTDLEESQIRTFQSNDAFNKGAGE